MRIGIISAMREAAWGGSEELWAAMAHRALEVGISVSVCLLRPHARHVKWEALRRAGADLFCEPAWCSSRFLNRADLLSYRLGNYFRRAPLRALFSTKPDVVLVSDGESIPPCEVVDVIRGRHPSTPYVILSENNTGNIPENTYRKRVARFYREAHLALFVAEANLIATERQLLEKLVNARVVRNPVNLNCLDPVDWPHEGTVSLASIARLSPYAKGQDILLEALCDDRWRCRDWRLSIYGTGICEAYFKDLSAYYGLSQRVLFHGQTEDIRAVWQAHHALVLPSRQEGMPLVVVEAMMCSRPVIATAVAGIPEWVEEGRNGFLADAATVGSYAAALERAWQRRAEWPAMGRKAREDALGLYDPTPGDTLLSIVTDAAHSICMRND